MYSSVANLSVNTVINFFRYPQKTDFQSCHVVFCFSKPLNLSTLIWLKYDRKLLDKCIRKYISFSLQVNRAFYFGESIIPGMGFKKNSSWSIYLQSTVTKVFYLLISVCFYLPQEVSWYIILSMSKYKQKKISFCICT